MPLDSLTGQKRGTALKEQVSIVLATVGVLLLVVAFFIPWAVLEVHVYLMEIPQNMWSLYYSVVRLGPTDGVAYFLLDSATLPLIILTIASYTLSLSSGIVCLWERKIAYASAGLVISSAFLWMIAFPEVKTATEAASKFIVLNLGPAPFVCLVAGIVLLLAAYTAASNLVSSSSSQ